MKKITMSIIFFFFAVLLFENAKSQPVPEVLWYIFDQTGTNITNYASSPPAGTATAVINGTVSQGNTGLCGGALVGSGIASSTDYVNTGWAPNIGGNSWTISFWTKDITPSSTLFYIFGDGNSGSFRCFTNGVAGATNWILRGAGLTDIVVNGAATVTPSMTTFVYDATLNNVKAYLNGVLVNTIAQNAPNLTGTGPFKVGGYNSNVGLPLNGLMDEYRFYDRALTDAEILSLLSPSTYSNITVAKCSSYTSPSGRYTWTNSGVYSDTLVNSTGCDSIISIDLTIKNPTTSSISPVGCGSYTSPSGKYTWNLPGVYLDTIQNFAGCDSVITIDLSIHNTDNSVNQVSNTLTANLAGALYQWLDCNNGNAPIVGENGQTFVPAVNGNYAVEINDGVCTVNSSCYVISTISVDNLSNSGLDIYPNPVSDILNIQIANENKFSRFEIINSIGSVIEKGYLLNKNTSIETRNYKPGVYMLKIFSENKIEYLKFVKK